VTATQRKRLLSALAASRKALAAEKKAILAWQKARQHTSKTSAAVIDAYNQGLLAFIGKR
jgi:uncharacterized protein